MATMIEEAQRRVRVLAFVPGATLCMPIHKVPGHAAPRNRDENAPGSGTRCRVWHSGPCLQNDDVRGTKGSAGIRVNVRSAAHETFIRVAGAVVHVLDVVGRVILWR